MNKISGAVRAMLHRFVAVRVFRSRRGNDCTDMEVHINSSQTLITLQQWAFSFTSKLVFFFAAL